MNPADAPVLIVEDSDEDYVALVRALQQLNFARPLRRCRDGDECLNYLRDSDRRSRPALILLDLNLPGTDGREVLEQVKGDPALRSIPVTIVTTSSAQADVDACYGGGANSYVAKRGDFGEYRLALQRLMDYWFVAASLPTTGAHTG
jgi:CheY-like chemotaxis protein